jgi:hypothetical protein
MAEQKYKLVMVDIVPNRLGEHLTWLSLVNDGKTVNLSLSEAQKQRDLLIKGGFPRCNIEIKYDYPAYRHLGL